LGYDFKFVDGFFSGVLEGNFGGEFRVKKGGILDPTLIGL
jgi:hypothetical protein